MQPEKNHLLTHLIISNAFFWVRNEIIMSRLFPISQPQKVQTIVARFLQLYLSRNLLLIFLQEETHFDSNKD
jgi:hypothetical protein